eukprot:3168952-Lingulodinium_polyedra.AAC.1
MPQSEMVNFGSKNWPAWACNRCHAASKALANAVKNNQTLKEELTALKRNKVEQWKAKVRSCRIDPDNSG